MEDPYDYTEVGSREYELTNHLLNVMATVSDKKIGSACFQPPGPITICPGEVGVTIGRGGSTQYYSTEVLSATDYYPFGMVMPGRQYSAGSYRYGFNGKESDPENCGIGNQYDYGYRIYNPRIGRFLSVDPIAKNFPWNSPYAFAENQVIRGIDFDGLEVLLVNEGNEDDAQIYQAGVNNKGRTEIDVYAHGTQDGIGNNEAGKNHIWINSEGDFDKYMKMKSEQWRNRR